MSVDKPAERTTPGHEGDVSEEPGGRVEPPRRLPTWHPVARIFFYCGTILLVANLASLVVLFLYLAIEGQTGTMEARLEEMSQSPRAELLLGSYAVVGPIAFLWTAFFRRRIDLRSFTSLGITKLRWIRSLVAGTAIGLLAPGVAVIPGLLLGVYRLQPGNSPAEKAAAQVAALLEPGIGAIPILLLLFAGFMAQSATEELVLRGYVQRNMVEWKAASRNLVWILIVPSLLFSMLHGFNPDYSAVAAVNTVLIGVLFGAVVLGSGNLWSAIGLHGGWNFGLGCLWSLPVSGLSAPHLLEIGIDDSGEGARLFFGGGYGPEGGLIVSLLVVGGIVWALPRAMDAWLGDRWGTQSEPAA